MIVVQSSCGSCARKYRNQSSEMPNACGLSGVPALPHSAFRSAPRGSPYHRKLSVRASRTLPQLPNHLRVGVGERAALSGGRSDERLGVVGAALRIFDDAVLDAVDGVTGGDRGRGRGGKLARRDRITGRVHHDRAPQLLGYESAPVDRGRSRDDAVVVLRISLRFLSPCRPPVEHPLKYE